MKDGGDEGPSPLSCRQSSSVASAGAAASSRSTVAQPWARSPS
jgi:hypothetical protein